jgi:hypothetical protein
MTEPLHLYGTAIADSFQMRRISARAVRANFDRQLDWRLDLGMDSEGVHLVAIREVLPEDTYAGQAVRCHVYLKTVGSDEPVMAEIDLLLRDYAVLAQTAPKATGNTPTRGPVDIHVRAGDMLPDEDSPLHSQATRDKAASRALTTVVDEAVGRREYYTFAERAVALASRLDRGEDVLPESMALLEDFREAEVSS